MLKNLDVAIAWTNKDKASGKNFRTHNGRAWSYSLLVAEWTTNGTMVIYDYTHSAGNFVSRSTTKHVSALVEAAYKHAPGTAPLVITPRVPRRPYRPRRNHRGQGNR